MKARKIIDGVHWVGAVDWDRRLFDALIPLPDGTSYNSYLVQGQDRTALIDTVDPHLGQVLFHRLDDLGVKKIDFLVANHAEQDHSGMIPDVLARFPEAKVVTSAKGKGMLMDLLHLEEESFVVVQDGETLSLGGRTLEFIYAPWVHWPETMLTYLQEDKILFSCDKFGSHLATSDLYAEDKPRVMEAAKRYYAEIMMPFRLIIKKNLQKISGYSFNMIAPSHGPIYHEPDWIIDAYSSWTNDPPENRVVIPYVSMHNSTKVMVDYLVEALIERGVAVTPFDMTDSDLGKVAMALVDAATVVLGSPTVLGGAHPQVLYAALLANALRPKAKFASVIGSYSWGGRMVEQLSGAISDMRVTVLDPVVVRGLPKTQDLQSLDRLADSIRDRHGELALQ